MHDFQISIGPSGQFLAQKGFQTGSPIGEPPSIWNPGVYDQMRNSFRVIDYEPITNAMAGMLQNEYPVIPQADFDHYGEVLVQLTHAVVAQSAHLNLGLLRGAFRPCVIVEVMTRGNVAYEFVNYTQHTEREAEIMDALRGLLLQRDPQTEEFRIQITDTAIGGHGSTHLAKMLIGIKASLDRFKNQKWIVMFNLLHDLRPGTNTDKMRAIADLHPDGIAFEVNLYQVPNLITEDYDAGLGLVFDGRIVKPCSEEGKFVLSSNAGVSLIHSAEMKLTFDQLFTESVSDGLVTSPYYKQVADIWGQSSAK